MSTLRERSSSVSQLRLWASRGRLHAIIDATDTPAVPARARRLGLDSAVSLYRGQAEEELWSIAPFLFRVDLELLDWISSSLWSEPWGIFLLGDDRIDDLRTHFRRFLTVVGPEGESWYFRFYDPRVLAKYLPTCTDGELADFFGPVSGLGVTDPAGYGVTIWSLASAAPNLGATQSIAVRRG